MTRVTTKALAYSLGISTHMLRLYTKAFELVSEPIVRDELGYRVYTTEHQTLFLNARELVRVNNSLTIEDAFRELLGLSKAHTPLVVPESWKPESNVALLEKIEAMSEQQNRLEQQIQRLTQLVESQKTPEKPRSWLSRVLGK